MDELDLNEQQLVRRQKLAELRSMGVDLVQGYYIGRPESELGSNMRWPLV